jgi:hypothetical protein
VAHLNPKQIRVAHLCALARWANENVCTTGFSRAAD